jgi:hypothetical protein
LRDKLRASVPVGRNARAEEVAAMAAYLASDEAGCMAGLPGGIADPTRCRPTGGLTAAGDGAAGLTDTALSPSPP